MHAEEEGQTDTGLWELTSYEPGMSQKAASLDLARRWLTGANSRELTVASTTQGASLDPLPKQTFPCYKMFDLGSLSQGWRTDWRTRAGESTVLYVCGFLGALENKSCNSQKV